MYEKAKAKKKETEENNNLVSECLRTLYGGQAIILGDNKTFNIPISLYKKKKNLKYQRSSRNIQP